MKMGRAVVPAQKRPTAHEDDSLDRRYLRRPERLCERCEELVRRVGRRRDHLERGLAEARV
jgi:hypothetical protein